MTSMTVLGLAAAAGASTGALLNPIVLHYPRSLMRQWLSDAAGFLSDTSLLQQTAGMPSEEADRVAASATSLVTHLASGGMPAALPPAALFRMLILPVAGAGLFATLIYLFGASLSGFLWCLFAAVLLAMSAIDWATQLLPDNLTLPLLWAGLAVSTAGLTIPLHDAVLGAIAGYLPLWTLSSSYKAATGQEAMGHGDLKLLSALGAWLGWLAVGPIVVVAVLLGAVFSLVAKLRTNAQTNMPFGPFLAGGGMAVLCVGAPGLLRPFGIEI